MSIRTFWRTGPNNYTTNLLPMGPFSNIGLSTTPFDEAHFTTAYVYYNTQIARGDDYLAVNSNQQVIKTTLDTAEYFDWELSDNLEESGDLPFVLESNHPNYLIFSYRNSDGDVKLYVVSKSDLTFVNEATNNIPTGYLVSWVLYNNQVYIINTTTDGTSYVLNIVQVDESGNITSNTPFPLTGFSNPSISVNQNPFNPSETYAVIGDYTNGTNAFTIYDVTNPNAIVDAAFTDIPVFRCNDILFESTYIYVVDVNGIHVYPITSGKVEEPVFELFMSIDYIVGTENNYGYTVLAVTEGKQMTPINRIGTNFILNKVIDVSKNSYFTMRILQQNPVIHNKWLFSLNEDRIVSIYNAKNANTAGPIIQTRFYLAQEDALGLLSFFIDSNYDIYITTTTSTLNVKLSKYRYV